MTTNIRTPDSVKAGEAIVAIARGWLGTPYHHQASVRGAGCDCLGLVRGVYAEYTGHLPETPPAYSADWAESDGRETMLEAAARHLTPCPLDALASGRVVIFRLRPGMLAKHAAILTSPSSMIHAIEGAPVAEVALAPWWRRRIAAVFAFPS
jgi:NlpC/P60 family putative phage cell wall peptidase